MILWFDSISISRDMNFNYLMANFTKYFSKVSDNTQDTWFLKSYQSSKKNYNNCKCQMFYFIIHFIINIINNFKNNYQKFLFFIELFSMLFDFEFDIYSFLLLELLKIRDILRNLWTESLWFLIMLLYSEDFQMFHWLKNDKKLIRFWIHDYNH